MGIVSQTVTNRDKIKLMIPSDEGSSKQQKTLLTPQDHDDQAEAEEGQRRDANHP